MYFSKSTFFSTLIQTFKSTKLKFILVLRVAASWYKNSLNLQPTQTAFNALAFGIFEKKLLDLSQAVDEIIDFTRHWSWRDFGLQPVSLRQELVVEPEHGARSVTTGPQQQRNKPAFHSLTRTCWAPPLSSSSLKVRSRLKG